MIRGLYTSATGMMTQTKIMDVISNNLANADSTSFKKDTVVTGSFKDVMAKKIDGIDNKDIGKMNLGVYASHTLTDFSQGSIKPTERKLDFAIDGEGFFEVSDEKINQKSYTRNGTFIINDDKKLATTDGKLVMSSENTPIELNSDDLSVNDKGEIYVNDKYIAKLKLVNIKNVDSLRKTGESLFSSNNEIEVDDFNGKVCQSSIETSNVNVIKQMVDMISVTRNYEANQKVITTFDESLQKSVNDIGRV